MKKYYTKSYKVSVLQGTRTFADYASIWFPITRTNDGAKDYWNPEYAIDSDIVFDWALKTLRIIKNLK